MMIKSVHQPQRFTASVNGEPLRNKAGKERTWHHHSTAFKQAFSQVLNSHWSEVDGGRVWDGYTYPDSITIHLHKE